MQISIIGSGNVAFVFGHRLKKAGHLIHQIIGRSERSTQTLANELECSYSLHLDNISLESDLYLICVQDDEVQKVIEQLPLTQDKIILHTAGMIGLDIFKEYFINYGVFYPLQSLKKQRLFESEIPILIDSDDSNTLNIIKDLALSISKNVMQTSTENRMQYHLCAVFCSNFTNFLYTLTDQFCQKKELDFSILFPLISETAQRLTEFSPQFMQTGPALRGDKSTMEKHLKLLESLAAEKKIYKELSNAIEVFYK